MASVTSSCRTGPPEVRRRLAGLVVMARSLTETERLRSVKAGCILAGVNRYATVPFRLGVHMKFLFDDESFSFEALRAAGFANYGGADLGEILVTARAIPDGDEAAWHREWKATAQRVEAIGRESLQGGHA